MATYEVKSNKPGIFGEIFIITGYVILVIFGVVLLENIFGKYFPLIMFMTSPFANQKTTIVNFAVWHEVLPDRVFAGGSFERWKAFASYKVARSQSGL